MMVKRRRPLPALLSAHIDKWDHEGTRPSVRADLHKAIKCGTAALGANVFASGSEERIVFHTCKSRACPSCGHRATVAWQREQWADLPEVPYAHVCLTMPDVLWPMFRHNRHVLHDLPAVGAQVVQQLALQQYGVRLLIMVIQHTFGGRLNFNCHLHMLVSQGGLREDGTGLRDNCGFDRKRLMELWRSSVIELLRQTADARVLHTEIDRAGLDRILNAQADRKWIININRFSTKTHFLAYAGRYARRPPVAQHRFTKIGRQEVRYMTKNTRAKTREETIFTPSDFLAALADHVPDRYHHSVRYFGLLAPRVKSLKYDSVFAFLGERRRPKPSRLRWASSLVRNFGTDPLVGRDGERMVWSRRLPPVLPNPRLPGI